MFVGTFSTNRGPCFWLRAKAATYNFFAAPTITGLTTATMWALIICLSATQHSHNFSILIMIFLPSGMQRIKNGQLHQPLRQSII